jgi:hypothetical protein
LLGLALWWRFAQGKWREINIFATGQDGKMAGAIDEPPLLSSAER